jgi:uncharacterized cupin superfamily protein
MSQERSAPLKPFSSLDIPWTEWSDVPRFAVRYRHLSRAAIGDHYRVGVATEELAPGKQSSPAHYHIFEEEHVFILEGALTVRIGAATYEMKAGDYVCFPAGQKAGHCLINNSGAVCRYVIIGERNPNEVSVFTDSNKVMVRSLGRGAIFDMAATRRYWEGEDTGLAEGQSTSWEAEPCTPGPPDTPKPPISSHDVAWHEADHGKGFFDRNRHLTCAAVGENYHVGVLIESPPPGMRGAPRHFHMAEEEHALVLEGEVTLLLGDERHDMKVGDFVSFPAGQKVGHSFLNSGKGPCSYLMVGERNPHDVCIMPDSNKVAIRSLDVSFDMSGVRDYLDGEQAS